MRYHLILVRMFSSESQDNKPWCRYREKGNLCTMLWAIIWYRHHEKQYGVPQKIKNRTILWTSNATSGYLFKGNKIRIWKRYLYFQVHFIIIHNSQDTKITCVHLWMNKENVILCVCVYLKFAKRVDLNCCNHKK